jgi:hypothetical protein
MSKNSKSTPSAQSPDRETRTQALDSRLHELRKSVGTEYHEAYVEKVHEERRARELRAKLARTILTEARVVEDVIECAASDTDIRHTPMACTVDMVRCAALASFVELYRLAKPGQQYLYVQDSLRSDSVVINSLICPRATKAFHVGRSVKDQILATIGADGVRAFFTRFVPVASQRIDMDLPSARVRVLGDKGNHAVFSKENVIGDWSIIGQPAVEYYIINK